MKIAIINGPNLNFLGVREPSVYGYDTYEDLIKIVSDYSLTLDRQIELDFFQSNSEGGLIDYIQRCYYEKFDGIIINPGAYTHYSYAIRDAIMSVSIPTIEVHLSNIHEREGFRSQSVVEDVCKTQIFGKGIQGYLDGIDYLIKNELGR